MPDCEARIDAVVFDLINFIKSKYLSRGPDFRPSDCGPAARFFTLDVITDLIYGEPFGYLTKNEYVLSSTECPDHTDTTISRCSIPAPS